jgi:tetratricopeptide (TPR) repeat protein
MPDPRSPETTPTETTRAEASHARTSLGESARAETSVAGSTVAATSAASAGSAVVEIGLVVVLDAADVLARAARWDDAARLLAGVRTATAVDSLALLVAQATVAVDQDFAQQTDHGPAALDRLEDAVSAASDPLAGWDHAMLRLRKDYATALFAGDRSAADALNHRAKELSTTAPTDDRAGHAMFYAGVIADNLRAAPADAFSNYTEALGLAHSSGDEFLESLALRHLGDHAHTSGDLELARTQWERSTALRQHTGHVFGALAQQALLAVLSTDEGNPEAGKAIAAEVHRWATQLGTPGLVQQAAGLMT